MAVLKENPSIQDFQNYLAEIRKERNWEENNPLEIFLLMSEEVGELAKAIRNKIKLYPQKEKTDKEIQEELAFEMSDIFSYLLDLASSFGIDLEQAFREKEAINAQRTWG